MRMKCNSMLRRSVIALLLCTFCLPAYPAPLDGRFTYQGRLDQSGTPVSGLYDFEFRLFGVATGGSPLTPVYTTNDLLVSNGVFTAQLDFGADTFFGGDPRWLEIAVRPGASAGSYTTLAPRQELRPTPYALYSYRSALAFNADAVPWSGLSGVPASFADDIDNDTTYSAGAGLSLSGTTFSLNQAFTDALYWRLNGNTIVPGQFLGTINNQPLDLRVNNIRGLRLEPTAAGAPNFIAGAPNNSIAAGVIGASIGGGQSNRIAAVSEHASIGGGLSNVISSWFGSIGGGINNTASGYAHVGGGGHNNAAGLSVVAGGWFNEVNGFYSGIAAGQFNYSDGNSSFLGGGALNRAEADRSFVGGGNRNEALGTNSVVVGGSLNIAQANYSIIVGGTNNTANGYGSFIGGGRDNFVSNFGPYNSILNGLNNTNDGWYATILGGIGNEMNGSYSTIGGGVDNWMGVVSESIIAGGRDNIIGGVSWNDVIGGGEANNIGGRASYSVIAGGLNNSMNRPPGSVDSVVPYGLTISGGQRNFIDEDNATIGGGTNNAVRANSATIAGGKNNSIGRGADLAAIAGGGFNAILDDASSAAIGGGSGNQIHLLSTDATISGGGNNAIHRGGNFAAIGGGFNNIVTTNGDFSVISGGTGNRIGQDAQYAAIPGGSAVAVNGSYSLAAGRRAKANHDGTFVWADDINADFSSTADRQFAIRANNGVMIQSTNTALDLRGGGAIRVAGANVGSGTPVFIHRATAANTSGNVTTIDHPHCNGEPNAILIVTHNFSRDTAVDRYERVPVGVWYDGLRWTIFHEDVSAMPVGRAFNVMVVQP
jgi:hypothetical protein